MDLMQAFYKQNQSTKDAILDLYSPPDGRAVECCRAHFRNVVEPILNGVEESEESEESESPEIEDEFVKVSLFFLVRLLCAYITTSTLGDVVSCDAIAIESVIHIYNRHIIVCASKFENGCLEILGTLPAR
jgi:hypothetical protein